MSTPIKKSSIHVGIVGLSQHGKSVLMQRFVYDCWLKYPHLVFVCWNGGEGCNQWTNFWSKLNLPEELCFVIDDCAGLDGDNYDLTDFYESEKPFLVIGGVSDEVEATFGRTDTTEEDYHTDSFEFFAAISQRLSPCVVVIDEVDEWMRGDSWCHPFITRICERGAHIRGERVVTIMEKGVVVELRGVSAIFMFRRTQDVHKRVINKIQHYLCCKLGTNDVPGIKRYITSKPELIEKITNLPQPTRRGIDDVDIHFIVLYHDNLYEGEEPFTIEFFG